MFSGEGRSPEPVFKSQRGQQSVVSRHKCPLIQFRAEVSGGTVRHDSARIATGLKNLSDEFIKTELFGTREVDSSINGRCGGYFAQLAGNFVRCYRLDKHRRHVDRVSKS